MVRGFLLAPALLAVLGMAISSSGAAKERLPPGSKPTEIELGREPFGFAQQPAIRPAFDRDQPFLEGEIAYGYTGRLVTPIQHGDHIVAPVGSPAYAVPMRRFLRPGKAATLGTILPQLVWCVLPGRITDEKPMSVCLSDDGMSRSGNNSMMVTGINPLDHDSYSGGEITPAPLNLGAPVRVRYYLHGLKRLAQIEVQISVGDRLENQWRYSFRTTSTSVRPEERLFSVGGGVIGITPDPHGSDHYTLRIVKPLLPRGPVLLGEVQNEADPT